MTKTIDFRLPENRRECFIQWYGWQLHTYDCDPAIYTMRYIFERMEFNVEQRYWLVWLFANTYQLPTAWVIANEFPDYENVDLDRLTEWNNTNYARLRYQVDNKWNKGHLPKMFDSYRKNLGSMTQHDFFMSLCTSDDPSKNFWTLWKKINDDFFKFGRYVTWFYLQCLKDLCDLPISADDLRLGDASESHRSGLCYALGKDEWAKKDRKFSKDEITWLEDEAGLILVEMRTRFPHLKPEMFGMETSLCAFKKLFRTTRGRYLGYYHDRIAEDITKVQADDWKGIDWDLLWNA